MTKKHDSNKSVLVGEIRRQSHNAGKIWLMAGITSAVLGITSMTNTQSASAAATTDSPAQVQDGADAATAQTNIQSNKVALNSTENTATNTENIGSSTNSEDLDTSDEANGTTSTPDATTPANSSSDIDTSEPTTVGEQTETADQNSLDVAVNYKDTDGNVVAASDTGIYGSGDLQNNVDNKVQSLKDSGYNLVSDGYDDYQNTTQFADAGDGKQVAINPTAGINLEDAITTVDSLLDDQLAQINAKYGTEYHLYSNRVDSISHSFASLMPNQGSYTKENYYLITSDDPTQLNANGDSKYALAFNEIHSMTLLDDSVYAAAARILSANGILTEVTIGPAEQFAGDGIWSGDSADLNSFDPDKSYDLIFEKVTPTTDTEDGGTTTPTTDNGTGTSTTTTTPQVKTSMPAPVMATADEYYNNLVPDENGDPTTTTPQVKTSMPAPVTVTADEYYNNLVPNKNGDSTTTTPTGNDTTTTGTPTNSGNTTTTTGTPTNSGNTTTTTGTPANTSTTNTGTPTTSTEAANNTPTTTGTSNPSTAVTTDNNTANNGDADADTLTSGNSNATNPNTTTSTDANNASVTENDATTTAAAPQATKVSYTTQSQAITANKLPQTNESTPKTSAIIGLALLAASSTLGLVVKKRKQD